MDAGVSVSLHEAKKTRLGGGELLVREGALVLQLDEPLELLRLSRAFARRRGDVGPAGTYRRSSRRCAWNLTSSLAP